MTFSFYNDIPASGNDPSVDQPKMLQNNISTRNILNVDHVTFNNSDGGKHRQVTYVNTAAPAIPTDPESVAYTHAGVASTSPSQYFKNSQGTFIMNGVRAFVKFSKNTNAPFTGNKINCATSGLGNNIVITTTAGAVNSADVIILTNASDGSGVGYTSSFGGGQLTINLIMTVPNTTIISVAVLQN